MANLNQTAINMDRFHSEADRRKSIGFLTKEALPRLENFRLSFRGKKRPSIGELHGDPQRKKENGEPTPEISHHPHFQLGWIQGVLIPVLLNIYGVMLFLRMGWIVAEAGVIESIAIVSLSAIICVITTLSLSAISTNGEVKGGGIYYIISRSLGPEFGASVGVVFAFANAISASMNTIGFCDSLKDLLSKYGLKIIDGGVNDTRIIGTIAIFIMIIICAVGMEWEVKAQNVLVVVIVSAIIDFVVGVFLGPKSDEELAKGFTGFSTEVLQQNLYPNYRFSEGIDQTIFTVFAIFFPSVTGIQAGANICGDLKDPASAIPKGTLLALFISMSTYLSFVILVGGSALRDASGIVSDIANQTFPYHFACEANKTCEFGLHNSYSMMQLMSPWEMLIYIGCFAATLSTALTNLLSVPRLVQALGWDRIFPGVHFFSKGYGKNGEPYRGYVLTFCVSVAFVLIADLNLVAPLITNFYLVAYALINFCTFHAAFVQPLGWRPSFRFYSKWLSLLTSIVCIGIMFFLSWQSSIVTLGLLAALYWIVLHRQPDANWGSSTQEQTYRTMLSAIFRLQQTGEHIKNYHPQVLVLAGYPLARPTLMELGALLTNNTSLLMVGDVFEEKLSFQDRNEMTAETYQFMNERKIKGFYNLIDDIDMDTGVRLMIQSTGFGVLSPNIVMAGYKNDWTHCKASQLKAYYNGLYNTFLYRMGLVILRMPKGLDVTPMLATHGAHINNGFTHSNANITNMDSEEYTSPARSLRPAIPYDKTKKSKKHEIDDITNFFSQKHSKGTIDVWWLYDDGGLTMLLPYIISTRPNWSNCKLRIFALTKNKEELKKEEEEMAKLLAKLRINYSSLVMLADVTAPPKETSVQGHERLIEAFTDGHNVESFVTQLELQKLKAKTNLHLRLRELLREHSSKSSLIVMSLPMPKDKEVSAPLYMSWLEVLTRGMPPFLLVRGNQTSVLTFSA